MRYLLTPLLLLFPLALSAQEKKDPKPGDEMIQKYLNAETDKLSQKFLDGAKNLDEWKQKLPRLYQEYMDMLGLWPIPEKTPLKATVTGTMEAHGVVVENIHFQSKPGLYVTANLYRPKGDSGAKRKPLPAILYVCGHSNRGRDGNKTAFQDHGFWFANNGYVCIVLDTLQLGEIPAVHHGTYGRPWISISKYEASRERQRPEYPKDVPENRFWWHSIGYSPAAVECWNGMRAIDYLCTLPYVDPNKIGVTGISGGGAATFWIAAADERVKVAVPVSGMADLESYVKNKVINGHCDCMFLYNTYQWDWTTIAALVAPRPMLFANSDKDPIFPMDANRRVYKKLQQIYGMYGVEKAVGEYVSVGGHDYRPDLRKAIFHFFNVHLKRMPTAVVEDSAKYEPLDGKKLRVFRTDDDLPKDAINARIDELLIPAGRIGLPDVESLRGEKYEAWKSRVIAKLRQTILRNEPRDITESTERHIVHSQYSSSGRVLFFISVDEYTNDEKRKSLIDAFAPGKTSYLIDLPKSYPQAPWDPARPLTISERYSWTVKSPPNYFERSFLLLGRTMDEMKLFHFISTIRSETKNFKKTENVRLIGTGSNGILAAYAALFEPSIKEVIVIDPPKSHKEGPHFLNVLRVLDIPEALGLLAPTPLTIIGGKDAAFDRTEAIYRLAGAGDKLVRK